jgi:hypothetical protein
VDLNLFSRVLRRFRVLIIAAFVLAIGLAFISYVRIGFSDGRPQLSYRQSEGWTSYSQVLVTQPGFAFGNTLAPKRPGSILGSHQQLQAVAEPRLTTLASLYSRFVGSDEFLRILLRGGPARGVVSAAPLTTPGTNDEFLPIVNIAATGRSREGSLELARRASVALRTQLADQQAANRIPQGERVQLRVLLGAGLAELSSPRKKTLPAIAFFTVMLAGLALAFVLENLRPRVRVVEPAAVALPNVKQRSAS